MRRRARTGHSHASHAIAAGMPIEIAQQTLGHASLAHHDGLRDHREQAADAGGGALLEDVTRKLRVTSGPVSGLQ